MISREARVRGASAAHLKIVRADGTVEYRICMNRPRPIWNLRAWLWLLERRIEYRHTEKNDG